MADNQLSTSGNGLIERVKGVILKPAPTWDAINAESASVKSLMLGVAAPLAAIGPVAALIGGQLFGYGAMGINVKPDLGAALQIAIVTYVLALAGVFVLSLIIDALAPTFGGTRNKVQALKVAVYSSVPGWVAGALGILPALTILIVIAGIYGLYVMYLGLPKLMKSPPDKAVGYTAAAVVSAIVIYMIVGYLASQLMPAPAMNVDVSGMRVS